MAVPKPDGSPRPVAIGETFYKMAAFMALESNGTVSEVLGPSQFAFLRKRRRSSSRRCWRRARASPPIYATRTTPWRGTRCLHPYTQNLGWSQFFG